MSEKNIKKRLRQIKEVYEDYVDFVMGPLSTPAMEDHYKKMIYIITNLDLPEESTIHDAGCGHAHLARRIFEALNKNPTMFATDWVEGMIKKGEEEWKKKEKYYKDYKEQGKIQLRVMDLSKEWLWSEEKFNLQVFSLVLCYLPSIVRKEILRKTFETTKPNGYLVCSIFLKGFSFKKATKKFKMSQGIKMIFSRRIRFLVKLFRGAKTTERLDEPMPPEEYPGKEEFFNDLEEIGYVNIKTPPEYEFLEKGWGRIFVAQKPSSY